MISFDQKTVFLVGYTQFHSVTASQLEGYVIVRECVGVMMLSCVTAGDMSALVDDADGDRDSRRVVVFTPLTETAYNSHNKHTDDQYEHDSEHGFKHLEAHTETIPIAHDFFLSILKFLYYL